MKKAEFQLKARVIEEHLEMTADVMDGMLRQDDGALEKFDQELGRRIRKVVDAKRELVEYVRSRRG